MQQTFTEPTGDSARRGTSNGAAWEKNSEFNDSCAGAYYPNIEESGSTRTAPVHYRPGASNERSLGSSKRPPSDLATRDAVRRAVSRAAEQTDRMIEAAKAGDAMELSNAGFDLVNVLEELWTLRAHREPNWRDLLNLLQGALAQEHFEAYTQEKCVGISEVVCEHLKAWTVDDDDIRASISILRQAGLDPWKGISAPSEN